VAPGATPQGGGSSRHCQPHKVMETSRLAQVQRVPTSSSSWLPGGCLGGGGSPSHEQGDPGGRAEPSYGEEKTLDVRRSRSRTAVVKVYEEFLTDGPGATRATQLLHTHYVDRGSSSNSAAKSRSTRERPRRAPASRGSLYSSKMRRSPRSSPPTPRAHHWRTPPAMLMRWLSAPRGSISVQSESPGPHDTHSRTAPRQTNAGDDCGDDVGDHTAYLRIPRSAHVPRSPTQNPRQSGIIGPRIGSAQVPAGLVLWCPAKRCGLQAVYVYTG